jgi:hypothetical protein
MTAPGFLWRLAARDEPTALGSYLARHMVVMSCFCLVCR